MTSFAHASVFGMALAGKRPRPRLGRLDGKRAQARNGVWRLFSAAGADTPTFAHFTDPGFASRNKIAASRRPPLRSGRCRLRSAVQTGARSP